MKAKLLLGLGLATLTFQAMASTLVINSNNSDPGPKAAFRASVEGFQEAYPDIEVKYNEFAHEDYKSLLRNWLVTSPPDIVYWNAGERMRFFVEKGLFEDVSDVWQSNELADKMPASKSAVTVNGKQYGVPYSYQMFGVFYNKTVFDKYGLSEPQTWDEFVTVSDTLKANGVAPIAIGTKYLWTVAGWFDSINLRLNGLDYHLKMLAGEVPMTDDGVRAAFEYLGVMAKSGYFMDDHASYSFQEAIPQLLSGDAAMYHLGSFITPFFDKPENYDFFRFPMIKADMPFYEDAPAETIHIPSKAKNKDAAKLFLAYMARPEVQAVANKHMGQLSPNRYAEVSADPFLQQTAEALSEASGTSQFFDRDTDPAFASEAMKGMQEYILHPDRLDKILNNLERVRKRVFKK